MPRKPTLLARQAREGLLELVRKLPKDTCLPTLGEMAGRFQLHPSTIFRLQRDMAAVRSNIQKLTKWIKMAIEEKAALFSFER